MKLREAIFTFCSLACLHISLANASPAHTVKGVVITSDGTVVPEFTVVIRHAANKPELVQRKHFKNSY